MRVFLLAVAAAIGFGAAAHAADIRFYSAVGRNPDGSEYLGSAYIEKTGDNTCRFIQRIKNSTIEGICMWYRGFLAASFTIGDNVGLVIYKVNSDGSMEGGWTLADTPGVGTEMLTPITGR